AVDSHGDPRLASHYLIAAGAWSERFLQSFDCKLDIHPVRGQIVLYRTEADLLKPLLIRGQRYLVPRGDGLLLAGSTEEPEAGFDKSTTEAGIDGLKQFAEMLLPGLRSASIEKCWAGLRPGSRDGLPFIG